MLTESITFNIINDSETAIAAPIIPREGISRKQRIQFKAAATKDAKSIGFNAKMKVNLRSEKMMTFDEAWQALNTRFYDPNFHGADWSAMKKKYRSWAAEASCAEDFYDVVLMMIGELNSSHTGIYGPSPEERVTTGLLGTIFDETYQGPGMKIKRIVPKSSTRARCPGPGWIGLRADHRGRIG